MSTTDEVVGSIDHTLRDWSISRDAMRWSPESQPQPAEPPVDLQRMQAGFRVIGEAVTAWARAVAKVAQQVGKAYVRFAHALATPDHRRARCRICSPMANPAPLALGREYRRRTRRRNRR